MHCSIASRFIEQHEIVQHVVMLFERADAIDREVMAVDRRCERPTQAVLEKAFRGEIVGSQTDKQIKIPDMS